MKLSLFFVISFVMLQLSWAALTTFGTSDSRGASQRVAQDVSPDKAEYRTNVGTEQHKFGYELSENKHFHHTTTDEDGVRLGCYGHVLEGKKYSTQYVADMRGYRPVITDNLITVYPKSGGEKKASFLRQFNEAEMLSQNIRFFFPDGCVSKHDLEPAASVNRPVVVPAPATRPTTPRPTTPYLTRRTTTKEPNCVCTCT